MIIAIPEVLRDKLGPEGARALTEVSVSTRSEVIETAANRFEREPNDQIERFSSQMHAFERRLIRQMLLQTIGQIVILLAACFAFFRT